MSPIKKTSERKTSEQKISERKNYRRFVKPASSEQVRRVDKSKLPGTVIESQCLYFYALYKMGVRPATFNDQMFPKASYEMFYSLISMRPAQLMNYKSSLNRFQLAYVEKLTPYLYYLQAIPESEPTTVVLV